MAFKNLRLPGAGVQLPEWAHSVRKPEDLQLPEWAHPTKGSGEDKGYFDAMRQHGHGAYFADLIKNSPGSAANLVKDVTAFIHSPKQTWEGVKGLAVGAFQKLRPGEHPDEAVFDEALNYWKQRMGSPQRIAATLREDPFGMISDLAMPFTLGLGLARNVAKTAAVAGRAASAVSRGRVGGGLQQSAARVAERAGELGRRADSFDPATYAMRGAVTAPLRFAGRSLGMRSAQTAGAASGVGGRAMAEAYQAGREGGAARQAFTENLQGDVAKDRLQFDVDEKIDQLRDEHTERADQRRRAMAEGMGEVPLPPERLDPRRPENRAAYIRLRALRPMSRLYQESWANFMARDGMPGSARARQEQRAGVDPGVTEHRSEYASAMRQERLTGPLADERSRINDEVIALNEEARQAFREEWDTREGGSTPEERLRWQEGNQPDPRTASRQRAEIEELANKRRTNHFQKIGEYAQRKETELDGLEAEGRGGLERADEMIAEAETAKDGIFRSIDAKIRVSNQQEEVTRLFARKREIEANHFKWMEEVVKPMQDEANRLIKDAREQRANHDKAVQAERARAESKWEEEMAAAEAEFGGGNMREARAREREHIAKQLELEEQLRDLSEWEGQRVTDQLNFRRQRQLEMDRPAETTPELQRRRDAETAERAAADAREHLGRPFEIEERLGLAERPTPRTEPGVQSREDARFAAEALRRAGRHGESTAPPQRDPSEARPQGPDREAGWEEGPDPNEPRWKRMRRAAGSYMQWAYNAAAPSVRRGVRGSAEAFSRNAREAWINRATPFHARREALRERLGFRQTEGSKEAQGRGRGRDIPSDEEMRSVARAPIDWTRVRSAVNDAVHDISPTGFDRAPVRPGSVRERVAKAIQDYDEFKDADIFYTVMGMDDFRRRLVNIKRDVPYQDQGAMSKAIKAAEKEIKAQAPDVYVRFLEAMEAEGKHFDELATVFKTQKPGQRSQGIQVLERLWDPRGDSRDFQNDLFESLQIPHAGARMAGQRASSFQPGMGWRQILQGTGLGAGAASIPLGLANPLLFGAAATASGMTSPRLMGNLAHQAGRVAGSPASDLAKYFVQPERGALSRQYGLAGNAAARAEEEKTLAEVLAGWVN